MAITPQRLRHVEVLAISGCGLVLLSEIGRAIRWNLFWMDRAVVTSPRFNLYLWTALAFSALLILKGTAAMRWPSGVARALLLIETLLTLLVGVLLVIVVNGWRMRTDVVPFNAAGSTSVLPWLVRMLSTVWLIYAIISIIALAMIVLLWRQRKVSG
jgi:hypothetical protein